MHFFFNLHISQPSLLLCSRWIFLLFSISKGELRLPGIFFFLKLELISSTCIYLCIISSNGPLCFICSACLLSLCKKEHDASALAKIATRRSFRVLNCIKQCHALFLIWSKNRWFHCCIHFRWWSVLSDPRGASRTGCSCLQMLSGFVKWGTEHWAASLTRACLYCCYYGNMPLHSLLCNKVFKFIYQNRMEEQLQPLSERERQRESKPRGSWIHWGFLWSKQRSGFK